MSDLTVTHVYLFDATGRCTWRITSADAPDDVAAANGAAHWFASADLLEPATLRYEAGVVVTVPHPSTLTQEN